MKRITIYFLIALLVLPSYLRGEELHYQDCVEITGGFYYQPNQTLVGMIMDKKSTADGQEYLVGNLLFGFWINQKDLKKIDKKICDEANKNQEGK